MDQRNRRIFSTFTASLNWVFLSPLQRPFFVFSISVKVFAPPWLNSKCPQNIVSIIINGVKPNRIESLGQRFHQYVYLMTSFESGSQCWWYRQERDQVLLIIISAVWVFQAQSYKRNKQLQYEYEYINLSWRKCLHHDVRKARLWIVHNLQMIFTIDWRNPCLNIIDARYLIRLINW